MMVGLRCDAGASRGVGHALRCAALAEELASRGHSVVLLMDHSGIYWLEERLDRLPVQRVPAPATSALGPVAASLGLDAVVLDGYDLGGAGRDLRKHGVFVLAVHDGPYGKQSADLSVDPNLGAEMRSPMPGAGKSLLGARFCLLQDFVRVLRPPQPPSAAWVGARPRVLVVFGGTDPFGAASLVIPLVLAVDLPLDVHAVVADPAIRKGLSAQPLAPSQTLRVVPPHARLPEAVTKSDVVVSAAGTSTWEFACLGSAQALVAVTGNQEDGLNAAAASGIAIALGRLDDLRGVEGVRRSAIAKLHALLTDEELRGGLRARAWRAIDGDGRSRVVDALEDSVTARAEPVTVTP